MPEDDSEYLAAAFLGQTVAGPQLDWRWRYCMSRVDRLESSGEPEVFFAGPAATVLLSDPIMLDYFYPYLRYRLGYGNIHPAGDEVVAAIDQAMDAASEWTITPHSWSLLLEAGVLSRRPVGEVMPSCGGGNMSRLGQIVYERLFFDIRDSLDTPRECAALLCANPDRFAERGIWDLKGKVIAYILGFDEFTTWRLGKPSSRAKALGMEVEQGQLYLDGLSLLGLDRQDDFAAALARQFESAARWQSEATKENRKSGYTREQVEELLSLMVDVGGSGAGVH